MLLSDEYLPYVSEIIIEGHTDTSGGFMSNLVLSQQRAYAVAEHVLTRGFGYPTISGKMMDNLRPLVTVNGRSYSDPVLNEDGSVNMDASRRVVFKFRLTDEQMINQLKNILESGNQAAAPEPTVEPAP